MIEIHECAEIIRWFNDRWPEHEKAIHAPFISINETVGEANIFIALPKGPYGSLIIKHHSEESSDRPTDEEEDYLRYHAQIGNLAIFTKGLKQAKQQIKAYMELDVRHWSQNNKRVIFADQ